MAKKVSLRQLLGERVPLEEWKARLLGGNFTKQLKLFGDAVQVVLQERRPSAKELRRACQSCVMDLDFSSPFVNGASAGLGLLYSMAPASAQEAYFVLSVGKFLKPGTTLDMFTETVLRESLVSSMVWYRAK